MASWWESQWLHLSGISYQNYIFPKVEESERTKISSCSRRKPSHGLDKDTLHHPCWFVNRLSLRNETGNVIQGEHLGMVSFLSIRLQKAHVSHPSRIGCPWEELN